MKSTNNFAVRFILRHTNNNLPEAVIFARIIVDKKQVEISLNKSIDPASWNREKQCAFGSKELVRRINPYIDEVRFKLNDCYRQLTMQDTFITAKAIKSLFVGEEPIHNTLLSLMHYHSDNSKMILKQGTLKNYSATEKYIHRFLKQRYKCDDVLLTQLNYQFISQFELFLRTAEPLDKSNPLTNNGIMKHLERLRKIVTMGVKLEWIPKDPFIRYKLRFQKTERDFLIEDEIEVLETIKLPNDKLEKTRDLFLFACYTGLAYTDMANLQPHSIIIGIDREYWIKTSRQKTTTKVNVPLLPQALIILDKYKKHPMVIKKGRALPFMYWKEKSVTT
ncbi:MAG TPA: site-specific integrase [Chitinophagaceae bacterium]|nr:site-specific integrase [Chitinophagaceae bacterium]